MDWKDVFYYSADSPSGLKRVHAVTGGVGNKVVLRPANTPVGTVNSSGYWVVKHQNKTYVCHRIIYEITNGSCDGFEVDHIDGNKRNNTPSNLRKVTKAENMRNRGRLTSNTSGVNGVRRRVPKHKGVEYPVWTAAWVGIEGTRHNRSFSVNKLGEDEARKRAVEFRQKIISILNEAGAGYTERHGI